MKLAEIGERHQQVAPVGADARQRGALARGAAIDFHLRCAESAGARVEGHRHHIVAHLLVGAQHRVLARVFAVARRIAHRFEIRKRRGAIIQSAAVGRPRGEGFHHAGCAADIAQFVARHIIEQQVRIVVDHLQLLFSAEEKGLSRLVAREHHPRLLGMPRGIDTSAQHTVALHVHAANVFAVDEHRSAVFQTHVEEHAAGCAVGLRGVAVHTVVVLLFKLVVVLINGVLVEIRQVSFVQPQLAIEFIGGFDESIGEIRVDGLLRHRPIPVGVSQPLAGVHRIDRNGQSFAAVIVEQAAPFERVEAQFSGFSSRCHERCAALSGHLHHDFFGRLVHLKIEGRNVGRDHHIAIVGKDCRGLRSGLCRFGHAHPRSTAHRHQAQHGEPQGRRPRKERRVTHLLGFRGLMFSAGRCQFTWCCSVDVSAGVRLPQ